MSAPVDRTLSRRGFGRAASLLGLGSALAASPAAAEAGAAPAVLRSDDAEGAVRALMSLRGTPAQPAHGWFDGVVLAVAAGGQSRVLCGYRGVTTTSARPLADGSGWQATHREAGYYCDPATGRRLDSLANPFTGRTVAVDHITATMPDAVYSAGPAPRLSWSVEGDQLIVHEEQRGVEHRLRTAGALVTGSQTSVHAAAMSQIGGARPMARSTGSWLRLTAWLPWMEMGDTPGHCIHHCTFSTGLTAFEQLPVPYLALAGAEGRQWLHA